MKFSTDGALLIAHSCWTNNNIITVFDASNGNVLTSRKFSTTSDEFLSASKSIAVSSGASPMAYVLSNYMEVNGGLLYCKG